MEQGVQNDDLEDGIAGVDAVLELFELIIGLPQVEHCHGKENSAHIVSTVDVETRVKVYSKNLLFLLGLVHELVQLEQTYLGVVGELVAVHQGVVLVLEQFLEYVLVSLVILVLLALILADAVQVLFLHVALTHVGVDDRKVGLIVNPLGEVEQVQPADCLRPGGGDEVVEDAFALA